MFPLTNHIEIVMAMKQVIQIRCKNNKKIVNVNIGSTLSDVLNEINLKMPYGPVCAKVNNKVEGLHYRLYHKKDVEFLDMTNREKHIYNGGYVEGLGYCIASVDIIASSNSSDSSLASDSSMSDSSEYSYPYDNPENPDNNTSQNGNGGNSSGSSRGSGNNGNNNSNNNIENAGEADFSSQYTYTEAEANALMDTGNWRGGYVVGLGYVLPCATILSPSIQSSREQILQNALQFINTPYKYGGTNASGIDCSGLVSAALNIQRWTTSSGDIPTTKKITIYGTKSTFVNELLIGDILVWRWKYYDKNLRRYVDKGHCCIYAGNGRIFHVHGAAGTPTGYTSDLLTYWVNKHGIPNVYRR